MAEKSWHLKRRTLLRGVGVSIALPYLEAMGKDVAGSGVTGRSCMLYVGNGTGNPKQDQPGYADGWHWFPEKPGRDFAFSKSTEPYKPFKDDITILGGLRNKISEQYHPHTCQDLWLTGGKAGGKYEEAISVDQAYAQEAEKHTRYSSLVLSCDGGIGSMNQLKTLSHNAKGTPIPSIASPKELFDRYFTAPGAEERQLVKRKLADKKKHVDRILEHAKSLKSKLGKRDQSKLDEYLQSLSDVEEKLNRDEAWLDVPMKKVDPSAFNLTVSKIANPEEYYRVMFDLIALAFEMDLTRSVSFVLSGEQGSIGTTFSRAIGLPDAHEITHNKTEQKFVWWGQYDRWMSSHLAYFLGKLKEREDHAGSLLDSSIVLNGSPSGTHNLKNNSLLLAGGKNLGLKHGRYLQMKDQPMCNLYATLLNRLGVPTRAFGDSDRELTEIL